MITNEYLVMLFLLITALSHEAQGAACLAPTWFPERYTIRLYPDMTSKDFNGQVKIQGVTTRPSKTLDLNSEGLKIKQVKLNQQDRSIDFVEDSTTLTLLLSSTLPEGAKFNLTINFLGVIDEDESGLSMNTYTAKDGSTKKVLSTYFQPNGARKVFPCLDEPKHKAIFELKLAVRSDLTALSNMPSRSKPNRKFRRSSEQYQWIEFEPTPKMSTYLLAFIVGEFEAVHLKKNTNVWIPRGEPERLPLHLDYLSEALDVLETYTGINYSMPKLDHVISVGIKSFGAMENWGLIMYNPKSLITENTSSTVENEEIIRTSTVHEMIHQWVGNLVTCQHWGYLWLNEGVTSFLVPIIWRQMSSIESNADNFCRAEARSAMLGEAKYPITLSGPETCDADEIQGHFNEATYYKGTVVLKMVDEVITDNCFQDGLRKYLKENLYGLVNESQLWASIDDVCPTKFLPRDVSLETVASTWSTNAGFPILIVHRNESTGRISVSQNECRVYGDEKNDATGILTTPSTIESPRWWIPLSYTTSREMNFENTHAKDWLEPSGSIKELNVTLSNDEWIIFNLKLTGYYRVQYDALTWSKLSSHLASGSIHSIHPINRANLVDDVLVLLAMGRVDFRTFFNFMRYLVHEDDPNVWKTALRSFTILEMRWPEAKNSFKKYARYLVDPIFKYVTNKHFIAATISQRSLRSVVIELACEVGHPECIRLAAQTTQGIINGTIKETDISPDIKQRLWCTGLSSGSLKLWQFIKESKERLSIFEYDTFWHCLDNDYFIKEILEDSMNGATYIRASAMDISNYFFSSRTCPVIEFFDENYEKVVEKYGVEKLRNLCGVNETFDSDVIQGCEDKKTLKIDYCDDLDLDWRPTHYRLQLWPDVSTGLIEGSVTVTGVATSELSDTVQLHSDVTVTEASCRVLSDCEPLSGEVTVERIALRDKHKLTLKLGKPLNRDAVFEVRLEFFGRILTDKGVFVCDYDGDEGESRKVIATEFAPISARRAFPCVDHPKYKAEFELKLARRANCTALSNMPLKLTEAMENNIEYVWDTFEPTPPISTYLVGFVICDFEPFKGHQRNTIWIRPELTDEASLAAEFIGKTLRTVEEYTSIDFVLPKLDHVATPYHPYAATENWGLITYQENSLLLNDGGRTIVHEIIHQWFGNLVTCESWSFAWLNEGVTSYLTGLIYQKMEPFSDMLAFTVAQSVQEAMATEAIEGPSALTADDLVSAEDIEEIFSDIIYTKGSAITNMAACILTPYCFRAGIVSYLRSSLYGTVNEEKLWKHLGDVCDEDSLPPGGINMETVMLSWTRSVGYPLLNVFREVKTGKVSVSQEHFYKRLGTPKFWVPLTFTTKYEKNFDSTVPKEWLEPGTNRHTLGVTLNAQEWIIFNIKYSAYLRVNYDITSWLQIADHLFTADIDDIHPVNRAQLIDDVFAIALTGRISCSIAMSMTKYLRKETHFLPWNSAKTVFESLLSQPTLHEKLQKYVQYLVTPVYGMVMSERYLPLGQLQQSFKFLIMSLASYVKVDNTGHPIVLNDSSKFHFKDLSSKCFFEINSWLKNELEDCQENTC